MHDVKEILLILNLSFDQIQQRAWYLPKSIVTKINMLQLVMCDTGQFILKSEYKYLFYFGLYYLGKL